MVVNRGVEPRPADFQSAARHHESLKTMLVRPVGIEPTAYLILREVGLPVAYSRVSYLTCSVNDQNEEGPENLSSGPSR